METVYPRAEETGTDTKTVGVEETDPRRPQFVIAEKSDGTGTGD